ncbi:MAG TPA: hypothetical protein VMU88_06475 [bacterium]|nr:hypothetical protein [bacterium]
MKENTFRFGVLVFLSGLSSLQAAPSFWNPSGTQTPTPVSAPPVLVPSEPVQYLTATPTPVVAPFVGIATPTPTPAPGITAKSPVEAALFSVVVPGSGQVYDGDPLKGLAFAAVFGVSLWQTIDALQLEPNPSNPGDVIAKDEERGSLFGLVALAAYGFGIEDALDGAADYNRRHYVSLSMGLQPMASASLTYHF